MYPDYLGWTWPAYYWQDDQAVAHPPNSLRRGQRWPLWAQTLNFNHWNAWSSAVDRQSSTEDYEVQCEFTAKGHSLAMRYLVIFSPMLSSVVVTFIHCKGKPRWICTVEVYRPMQCMQTWKHDVAYTVFQKKFTPMTFMITMWNENNLNNFWHKCSSRNLQQNCVEQMSDLFVELRYFNFQDETRFFSRSYCYTVWSAIDSSLLSVCLSVCLSVTLCIVALTVGVRG